MGLRFHKPKTFNFLLPLHDRRGLPCGGWGGRGKVCQRKSNEHTTEIRIYKGAGGKPFKMGTFLKTFKLSVVDSGVLEFCLFSTLSFSLNQSSKTELLGHDKNQGFA